MVILLTVAQNGLCSYHQHFTRQAQGGERSLLSDDALLVHIKAIHPESKGSYRRILRDKSQSNFRASRRRTFKSHH